MANIFKLLAVAAVFVALLVQESEQRIDGAPDVACGHMTPGHRGILPQNSPAPYTVTPSASTVQGGSTITVTVSSPTNVIRGIMLQARNVANLDGSPTGEWTVLPPLTRAMTCEKESDSVTHTSIADKSNLVFTWKAPVGFTERIVFRATVAETYDTFWTKIDSTVVTLN